MTGLDRRSLPSGIIVLEVNLFDSITLLGSGELGIVSSIMLNAHDLLAVDPRRSSGGELQIHCHCNCPPRR